MEIILLKYNNGKLYFLGPIYTVGGWYSIILLTRDTILVGQFGTQL